MRIRHHIVRFIKDDRGQSMTEYILILAVVVMVIMKFKNIFGVKLEGLVNKVSDDMMKAAEQTP
jgi:Flp pilus assembly pilin Flp